MKHHLKRISAPKSWTILRKERKFITRPLSGTHKLKECLPLKVILQNMLKRGRTAKEIKVILNKGCVFVDNRIIKEQKFAVGVMDTISIPSLNEYYLVVYDKKARFMLQKIAKENAQGKTCKITGKTLIKKNRMQLNFYDGRNLIVPKDTYKVGDSVILENNKIKKHIKFEKGAKIYLTGGKYIGTIGTLESIQKFNGRSADKITLNLGNEKIETSKEYAFVVE